MNIYFGENLKNYRLKRNLTQEKLAEFLGVSFQTISKWEHGDTYPDITILPDIAEFFGVSVDEMLGVNKTKNEAKILDMIERIDNLTDVDLRGEIIKEAIKDFPMDFRIQLRLMGHLYFSCEDSQVKERLPKIKSIYDNIQQNCTVDTIRIRAKRYMASCYACLSKIEGSGVDFEECEKILKDMPYMRDGKEFVKAIFYPEDHPSYYENIKNSIDVSAGLLASGLGRFYWDDNFSVDYKIKVQNMSIDILNMIYDDGNYGSQWREIMYLYLELGHLYHMKGDNEKAVLNLKKSAELAKQFDEMERITVMHSLLLEGKKFDKHTVGSTFIACSRIKELISERYPFSEDFRKTKEFKEILKTLSK